ncbi:hypothetical protein CHS0354_030383, partial [Potamilus streckersoni]
TDLGAVGKKWRRRRVEENYNNKNNNNETSLPITRANKIPPIKERNEAEAEKKEI